MRVETINTPAIRYLEEHAVPYRLFHHAGPIESLEQAAEERHQTPTQVIRSIVFRLAEDNFIMVLMPGPEQIPWKKLRRYVNQSRLTLANEEELLAATGYRPGTVNPFGLPQSMRILIDRRIADLSEISLGSGQRGWAILLNPQVLSHSLDQVEWVDFSGQENGAAS
jgi:Cys-tRNA(Pro) deacylase